MPKRIYADLKEYLEAHPGESQRVADDVGCSFPHLSQIKWHERQPTLPLALRIARRCNVPLETLVLNPAQLEKELADMAKSARS